jgi:hypothetical protein
MLRRLRVKLVSFLSPRALVDKVVHGLLKTSLGSWREDCWEAGDGQGA